MWSHMLDRGHNFWVWLSYIFLVMVPTGVEWVVIPFHVILIHDGTTANDLQYQGSYSRELQGSTSRVTYNATGTPGNRTLDFMLARQVLCAPALFFWTPRFSSKFFSFYNLVLS